MSETATDEAPAPEVDPPEFVTPELVTPEPATPELVALELTAPPAIAERLFRLPAIAALSGGRTRPIPATMVWHDAAGGDLGRRGLSLVETRGLWYIEVARRDGARPWPPGAPAPVLEQSDHPGRLAALADMRPGPLLPVASLEGQLRALKLVPDAPIAGLELLTGALTVAGLSRPVARLALVGPGEPVFALAANLLEAGLAIPATSLGGEVCAAAHGRSAPATPALRPDQTLDDAFAHVVGQLAAALAHHAPGARLGAEVEPVHQMRVALRRLRSALSLFRRAAGGADVDRVRADLTALARALGPARDWDVFLAGIARDVARLLPDEPAIGRMTAAARRQRGAAYASLATLLDAPAFQRTLLDLAHLAIVQPWRHGVAEHRPLLVDFARQALNRRLRRVLEAGDDLAELPAADLHAVRIQCKRLRYAAEFFAPLTPGRQSRRFLRRLAAVQERLGHLNDAAVAGELLAPIGGRGFAAGIVRGYLAARSAGGRAKAERSWKKFRRAEPFWS